MLAFNLPTRALFILHTWLMVLAGCASDRGATATTGTTATGHSDTRTSTTLGTSTTTAAPTTSTTSSVGTSTSTTTGGSACPDGNLDQGEACDDGNTVNGDGCNNDCRVSGELLGEYRSGVPGHDRIRGVAVDSGEIIIGGEAGTARHVARFDWNLKTIWSETYGDTSMGVVNGVAAARGEIYVAGAVYGDVDGHDIWIGRLASEGALEWEDVVSTGFGNDYLNQIEITADNGIVVTGLASVEGGLTALWTRKYGSNHNSLWTASYPLDAMFNIYPLGPALAVTPDAVIVGWQLPTDNWAELLVAYPLGGGDPLWAQSLPGKDSSIKAIAVDPRGDLVLTGQQDQKFVVRRATSSGAVSWSSLDCAGRGGRDVAIDSQGDIVVIGDGPGSKGNNIRLCKFSSQGEFRWGKDIDGGFGDDFGYAVGIGPGDQIIAGGWVRSEQNGDDSWLAIYSP